MKKFIIACFLLTIAGGIAFATVSSTTTQNVYTCNGTDTVFPYTFKIFASADLYVASVASTGVETQITTGFSVSGVGTSTGGNVTFSTAPVASTTLLIRRQTVQHQSTDLVPNARLNAASLENAYDKLTLISQDQQNQLDRTVKFKSNTAAGKTVTLPEPVAGNYLVWNTGGTALENSDSALGGLTLGTMASQNANAVAITGGTVVGITDLAVADGGTGASSASSARTNLGLGTIATQNAAAVTITDLTVTSGDATALTITTLGTTNATIGDVNLTSGDATGLTVTTLKLGGGAATVSTFGISLIDDAAASNARTTLGLGTMATQNSSAVTVDSLASEASDLTDTNLYSVTNNYGTIWNTTGLITGGDISYVTLSASDATTLTIGEAIVTNLYVPLGGYLHGEDVSGIPKTRIDLSAAGDGARDIALYTDDGVGGYTLAAKFGHLKSFITQDFRVYGAFTLDGDAEAHGLTCTTLKVGSATMSSYIQTLIDDATASDARATLGLSAYATTEPSAFTATGGEMTGVTIGTAGIREDAYFDYLNATTIYGHAIDALSLTSEGSILTNTYLYGAYNQGNMTNNGTIYGGDILNADLTYCEANELTVSTLKLGYGVGFNTVSQFGVSLIDDATAAAACTTLGLGTTDAVTFSDISVASGDATTFTAGTLSCTTLNGATPGTTGLALLDDSTASDARTTLGLGTMATQNSNAVSISGGTATGIHLHASADFSALTATTADINGGTIDATTIGGGTPAVGTFTTAIADSGDFSETTIHTINDYGIIQGDDAKSNVVMRKETFWISRVPTDDDIDVQGSVTASQIWNEDAWQTVTAMAKGYTGTYYDFASDGKTLTVYPTNSRGSNFIAELASSVVVNNTTTDHITVETTVSAGTMIFSLWAGSTNMDMTDIAGSVVIEVLYLTDD